MEHNFLATDRVWTLFLARSGKAHVVSSASSSMGSAHTRMVAARLLIRNRSGMGSAHAGTGADHKYLFRYGQCPFLNRLEQLWCYACRLWFCIGAFRLPRREKRKDEPWSETGRAPYQFRHLNAYGAAPYAYWQFAHLGTNSYTHGRKADENTRVKLDKWVNSTRAYGQCLSVYKFLCRGVRAHEVIRDTRSCTPERDLWRARMYRYWESFCSTRRHARA